MPYKKAIIKTFALLITVIALGSAWVNITAAAEKKPAVAAEPVIKEEPDKSKVCMINNRYMGSGQIPVTVDGKTYYGCCAGCAKTLTDKKESRMAKDPLTGKEVDKATAFIAVDYSNSTVYYFENKANYEKFIKTTAK
ncbi:MAG: hypothetical protein OEV59_05840 [Deltaproteobacteria bacterium]|nr:hypothetical protein [Deltaproteobacteria bacterium]